MFIYCPCVVIAYYVFVCLPCDVPMFGMCLVDYWFVTWLPLVKFSCFVLAQCYFVVPLHGDAYGVAN